MRTEPSMSRYQPQDISPANDLTRCGRELLLKTASLVKPIMRKHGWKVGLLAEVRRNELEVEDCLMTSRHSSSQRMIACGVRDASRYRSRGDD